MTREWVVLTHVTQHTGEAEATVLLPLLLCSVRRTHSLLDRSSLSLFTLQHSPDFL